MVDVCTWNENKETVQQITNGIVQKIILTCGICPETIGRVIDIEMQELKFLTN